MRSSRAVWPVLCARAHSLRSLWWLTRSFIRCGSLLLALLLHGLIVALGVIAFTIDLPGGSGYRPLGRSSFG